MTRSKSISAIRGVINKGLWHTRHAGPRLRNAWRVREPSRVSNSAIAALTVIALTEHLRMVWRRLRRKPPRLLWGPSAILNNKYWSVAMRTVGYQSLSFVNAAMMITAPEDFDVHRDDLVARSCVPERWLPYVPFAWALRNADVFLMYFDGGFLRHTDLDQRELKLLRLAGKKLIVSPFGGDIAVPGHLGAVEEMMWRDYPDLLEQAAETEQRVLRFSQSADANVLTLQPGFQPGSNVLWANQLAIDTDSWKPRGEYSGADGRNSEVTILHAPNHRAIKGTEHLEHAVDELRSEGLKIKLEILEHRPNTEIRAAMARADIVVDQLLFGYGLFATEALACGKPVISNLEHVPESFRDDAQMRACPLVSSTPETVREDLRSLVESPELRQEVGETGRDYTMQFHSYEAVARGWDAIIQFAWKGSSLPEEFTVPPGSEARG